MGSLGEFAALVPLVFLCFCSTTKSSIEQRMRQDTDLSQFYSMIEQSEAVNSTLRLRQVTIFAPTNEAFQNANFNKSLYNDDRIVRYHLLNAVVKSDQLGSSNLMSDLEAHPPLWITQKTGKYSNDIYVNNAKILINQSNIVSRNAKGYEQVLHKIDGVLVPVVTTVYPQTNLYNPNAWEFIDNAERFINMRMHRIRVFKQKVQELKKQSLYNDDRGAYTFFIPVDEGFTDTKVNWMDAKVLDGHIIPKKVLFTTPVNKDENFATQADADNMKVFVSFSQETEGKSNTIYVKSHTLLGDSNHTKGVVMAAIKEANIPVKNGVVHLLHQPLMIVDHTVKEFLEEKENGPLSKFCQEIADAGSAGKDFMRAIERAHHVTLFAPTNAAWEDGNLKSLLKDKSRVRDILYMHLIIDDRVYMDKILNKAILKSPTYNTKKNLFFEVLSNKENRTVLVEGGGVTATVLQSDIAAKNGVIHIIDRVLGVPYSTLYDKLRDDRTLNDTYILGSRSPFNEQLNDTSRKFTYFVPSAKAWKQARIDMASEIKKIFMQDYSYHAEQILERHLVVADVPFTMDKIKTLGNNSREIREVQLHTLRDKLTISVEEVKDNTFIINWKGKRIPVHRPNVECTNGVIHVIDYPFIQQGDIKVSKASAMLFAPHLIMVLVARWLLL